MKKIEVTIYEIVEPKAEFIHQAIGMEEEKFDAIAKSLNEKFQSLNMESDDTLGETANKLLESMTEEEMSIFLLSSATKAIEKVVEAIAYQKLLKMMQKAEKSDPEPDPIAVSKTIGEA